MFHRNRLLLATCVSATLFAGFGCSSSDDDSDHVRHRDHVTRRDDRPVVVDRDERVVGDRVAGRGLNGIPAGAVRVERGPGSEELSYRPPRRGTVYVYDVDADKVVYNGELRNDDKFVLDADDNRAMINGRKVLDQDLKSKHRFEVYFDPER